MRDKTPGVNIIIFIPFNSRMKTIFGLTRIMPQLKIPLAVLIPGYVPSPGNTIQVIFSNPSRSM